MNELNNACPAYATTMSENGQNVVSAVFWKQQVMVFLYPCALKAFTQADTAVFIAAEALRLGLLEKGSPNKH